MKKKYFQGTKSLIFRVIKAEMKAITFFGK